MSMSARAPRPARRAPYTGPISTRPILWSRSGPFRTRPAAAPPGSSSTPPATSMSRTVPPSGSSRPMRPCRRSRAPLLPGCRGPTASLSIATTTSGPATVRQARAGCGGSIRKGLQRKCSASSRCVPQCARRREVAQFRTAGIPNQPVPDWREVLYGQLGRQPARQLAEQRRRDQFRRARGCARQDLVHGPGPDDPGAAAAGAPGS